MTEHRQLPTHAPESLHHLRRIGEHNAEPLQRTATALVECLDNDGLVFTAGAGHSLTGVMESFYRAGGLAAVRPLHHPELLPLNGAVTSTDTERRSGLAEQTLAEAGFRGGKDLLVVFSNSGINPYPVELAATATAFGSTVVAITSPKASVDAPRRAQGVLAQHADIVLDTLVPAGDTSYPVDAPVTAPLSSLGNIFLWNLVLAEVHRLATETGVTLPWWRSSNIVGGDEANSDNLEHYAHRIPGLL